MDIRLAYREQDAVSKVFSVPALHTRSIFMRVIPWFKCKCGKLHLANFVTITSVCKCGEPLLEQIPVRSTNGRGENW